MHYTMNIAGLSRDLPLCRVTDDLYIGAFVIFGDPELTTTAAKELLKLAPAYDYMITAESKGIRWFTRWLGWTATAAICWRVRLPSSICATRCG